MAKLKFGMIVTDMRGKLGGHVLSKNRSGAIARTKVTPSNPQTLAQQAVRAALGSISAGWSALTEAQRASFNGAVNDWKTTDIFGDLKNPSGKNLFTKLNLNLVNAGLPEITVVPAKVDIPYLGITEALVDISDTEIDLGIANVPAGFTAQISATPLMTAGTNYVRGRFRVIAYVAAGALSPTVLYDAFVAEFGAPVINGNMYVRVKLIATTGQAGVPEQVKAVIAA